MYIQASGAVINLVMDPILIFGWFGFPALGIAGAALATVIGQSCGALIGIYLVRRHVRQIHVSFRHFRLRMDIIGPVFRVGAPAIVVQSLSTFMSLGLNKIFGLYSETYVAVLGAYFKLQNFIYMVVYGLGNAVVPMIAFNCGAHSRARVVGIIRSAMAAAIVSMLAGMVLLLAVPGPLLGLFNLDSEALAIGIPAMRIVSLSFAAAGGESGVLLYFSGYRQQQRQPCAGPAAADRDFTAPGGRAAAHRPRADLVGLSHCGRRVPDSGAAAVPQRIPQTDRAAGRIKERKNETEKLLLLTTGGTIASADTEAGLAPTITGAGLTAFVGSMLSAFDVEVQDILRLDSSNMQPEEWEFIARTIHGCWEAYDGVVLTHGTDTMAYTAAALSFLLPQGIPIPVVLTGAQLPITHPLSDATDNLRTAFCHGGFGSGRRISGVRPACDSGHSGGKDPHYGFPRF